jgi:uncharacterized SAM-binding protein YcdF (DUF218 family)
MRARLVAVLGYSNRDAARDLHPVCAARLARAAEEANPGDAVLFSGWRRRGAVSEAELMARGWTGRGRQVLLDTAARSTYGNVLGAATAAKEVSAREVVLVTSRWHGRRASTLMRAATRHPVVVAATDERGTTGARLRQLACWLLVPLQIALARRTR